MRLFLDAHLSARRTANALRKRGHDVRAAQEERALDGWSDEALLEVAHRDRRVLITCNVRDFARIATSWAEAGRHHSGLLMVAGMGPSAFGSLLRAIQAAAEQRPSQQEWIDYVAFI